MPEVGTPNPSDGSLVPPVPIFVSSLTPPEPAFAQGSHVSSGWHEHGSGGQGELLELLLENIELLELLDDELELLDDDSSDELLEEELELLEEKSSDELLEDELLMSALRRFKL